MTLAELNARDRRGFLLALEGVFENSQWVAEAAWQKHPFATFEALYRALIDAMRAAGKDAQLELIRAHPELSAKVEERNLTTHSRAEQAGAGLDRCSPEEAARLRETNERYKARFGFPFIIAVKGLAPAAILERLSERIERHRATEFEEALQQIERIAWLRLEAKIEA